MNDVLVIGGGLAGSSAAIKLARAGRTVTLIEKETLAHDKVCGEFLSHEAVAYLAALGLDLDALGAVTIDIVRFAARPRALPFIARSLSRRVLDQALLDMAGQVGVAVRRGRKAQSLDRVGDGWQARLDDDTILTAPTVFLASGKHDLRGHKRPAGRQNDLVAFKMHWRLSPAQTSALHGAVELFVFPGGYGGLQPIENGNANLCFLVNRSAVDDWDEILKKIFLASPLMAQRLGNAKPLWDKPLAISAIPYGYVRTGSDGLWRLGDQAAVIPSFSGDGMAIALHSAHLAASTFLGGGTAVQYQNRLAGDVGRQVRLATTISRALVSPVGQNFCSVGAAWLPALIGITAKATRIPAKYLAA